ncbi:hypothetical protein F1559_001367 [Cyanidiococcus yangmingshanensis]|uniref:Glucosidase II subunit alpha n=1 Tax=Cyanidiococcus yangmingshanensis TaxID=2690220 RepID=A0A7J7IJL9_9RHOD|nr:hypothetical protein F1559_001367 [Cyanidiococcus yangmingshanensis]
MLRCWILLWWCLGLVWGPVLVIAAQRDKYASCSSQPFCSHHRQQRALRTGSTQNQTDAFFLNGYAVDEVGFRRATSSQPSTLVLSLRPSRGKNDAVDQRLQVLVGAVTDSIFSVRVQEIDAGVGSQRRKTVSAPTSRYSPLEEVVVIPADAWLPLQRLSAPTASSSYSTCSKACWFTTANETVIMTRIRKRAASDEQPYHLLRIQHHPFRIALYNNLVDWRAVWMNTTAPALIWNAADLLYLQATGANNTVEHSVAADVAFPRAVGLYGLPEHALDLSLPETCAGTPVRLYNLDVFEYELGSELGLYGSVPFLLALNGSQHTVGVLWMPASETFVDLCPLRDDVRRTRMLHAHFISERGLPEMFLFAGPSPSEVSQELAVLTGSAPLPPLFSLGYHQSRWNYRDEADASQVDAQFDVHDIPYDVLWLDIEHTDGKKYFTWDANKFPNPVELQQALATKASRKLVTIVDPHVKAEQGYELHERARQHRWYIRTPDGQADYEGWCWPGKSHYPDFMDPQVQQGWSACFTPTFYRGMTEHLHIWVDMNEPSVFNGPEGTLPKNVRHRQGTLEHADIHNLYGQMVHRATFLGLRQGRSGHERPFVLSRSFFTGSQRYGAVWTGDNAAQWSHLAASVPMLLSIGMAGISFTGADVGGFFGDPSVELLTRWYQAAAYQPFFRGHAHLDTKRREPWLFGEPYTSAIRDAIDERYALLPYWYRLFATEQGVPVMRPLFYSFPDELEWTKTQTSWLVGDDILVAPVLEAEPTEHRVRLPGPNQTRWYPVLPRSVRLFSGVHTAHRGQDLIVYPRPLLTSTFVFQRGGSIVPRWERRRRSTKAMLNDPMTLHIALDGAWRALGMIYIDDGHSYAYQNGDYCLWRVAASGERSDQGPNWLHLKMTLQALDGHLPLSNASRCAAVTFERLVVYTPAGQRVVIRKPVLSSSTTLSSSWQGRWQLNDTSS